MYPRPCRRSWGVFCADRSDRPGREPGITGCPGGFPDAILRRTQSPPDIVVLDGYTANPGDLSWEPLESVGHCTVHDRTAPADIVPRAAAADIVLTNKTPITRETIEALPRLACIGVLATGYNIVDAVAARDRGIPVCNVPEYGTPNVVQATFALLLELTNRVGHHAETVRAGRWSACPD